MLCTSFLVIANEGQHIDIPDGCILENRTLSAQHLLILNYFDHFTGLVSGNLNMIVSFLIFLVRLSLPFMFTCVLYQDL